MPPLRRSGQRYAACHCHASDDIAMPQPDAYTPLLTCRLLDYAAITPRYYLPCAPPRRRHYATLLDADTHLLALYLLCFLPRHFSAIMPITPYAICHRFSCRRQDYAIIYAMPPPPFSLSITPLADAPLRQDAFISRRHVIISYAITPSFRRLHYAAFLALR